MPGDHRQQQSPSPDGSASSTLCRHTYTHLTYSRHHLKDLALSTIKISENGCYVNSKGETVKLKEDLDYAVEHCVHYEHEFDFHEALKKYDDERAASSAAVGVGGGLHRKSSSGGSSSSRGYHRANTLDSLVEGGDNPNSSDPAVVSSLGNSDRGPDPKSDSLGNSDRGGGSSKQLFGSFTGAKTGLMRGPTRGAVQRRFPRTSFLVVSASWLESASELLGACSGGSCKDGDSIRVGVLNSASATTPGGRFLKGTVSQEDCLCRASLLYSCISQPKFQSDGRFYGKNRSLRYGSSNCVIFSPGEFTSILLILMLVFFWADNDA